MEISTLLYLLQHGKGITTEFTTTHYFQGVSLIIQVFFYNGLLTTIIY
jgi:hypothetical protein